MQREWNSFWAGHGQGASLAETPVDAPSLRQAWEAYFTSVNFASGQVPRVADLACGTGEVARLARQVFGDEVSLTCLDYAPVAIETLLTDSRIDKALVGDAAALPFADAAFDMVCSQFGIEYAGEGAFAEVARVMAPGGTVRIVAHMQGGAVWSACDMNARAIDDVFGSGIFEAAIRTFTVMGEIRRGLASPQDLSGPFEEMKDAVPALQHAIAQMPQSSAGRELAERLYADFARIFGRITAYEPQDILDWCEGMQAETRAYMARMTAMTEAALDEEATGRCLEVMREGGLDMKPPQTLSDPSGPIAWVLEGRRPA